MLPRIAITAAAAGLLAACGSGTSASPPVAPPSTTQAAVTTSTTPSTVPATTLPATTTTVDPEAKVIADFLATFEAFNRCTADPARCDVSAIAAPGSPEFIALAEIMNRLARNELRGRPGEQDHIVLEDIYVASDGLAATVTTCMVDAGVIYDPRGTEDPSDDVVVNDTIESARTTWTLTLHGSSWKRSRSEIRAQQIGLDLCPPRESS